MKPSSSSGTTINTIINHDTGFSGPIKVQQPNIVAEMTSTMTASQQAAMAAARARLQRYRSKPTIKKEPVKPYNSPKVVVVAPPKQTYKPGVQVKPSVAATSDGSRSKSTDLGVDVNYVMKRALAGPGKEAYQGVDKTLGLRSSRYAPKANTVGSKDLVSAATKIQRQQAIPQDPTKELPAPTTDQVKVATAPPTLKAFNPRAYGVDQAIKRQKALAKVNPTSTSGALCAQPNHINTVPPKNLPAPTISPSSIFNSSFPATKSGIITSATGERHVPSSIRADGSIRRDLRVRPGYKPAEDVEAYKIRTAEAWKSRGNRKEGICGAESSQDSSKAQPTAVENGISVRDFVVLNLNRDSPRTTRRGPSPKMTVCLALAETKVIDSNNTAKPSLSSVANLSKPQDHQQEMTASITDPNKVSLSGVNKTLSEHREGPQAAARTDLQARKQRQLKYLEESTQDWFATYGETQISDRPEGRINSTSTPVASNPLGVQVSQLSSDTSSNCLDGVCGDISRIEKTIQGLRPEIATVKRESRFYHRDGLQQQEDIQALKTWICEMQKENAELRAKLGDGPCGKKSAQNSRMRLSASSLEPIENALSNRLAIQASKPPNTITDRHQCHEKCEEKIAGLSATLVKLRQEMENSKREHERFSVSWNHNRNILRELADEHEEYRLNNAILHGRVHWSFSLAELGADRGNAMKNIPQIRMQNPRQDPGPRSRRNMKG
ncbi:hypothetical protein K490DRAFT_61706 [Saccharata proteae CBS 121410]|uniref:WIBG Mago-binding domain-containing protein n=1 Tax=Saccharata proteae CBS 121410 TaxID=1314787 RepID=A0A9P4I5P0_9PEZI|nr:hypothetical protein K490DRAFT_61706 [Saccharata proteae CBS 121410]